MLPVVSRYITQVLDCITINFSLDVDSIYFVVVTCVFRSVRPEDHNMGVLKCPQTIPVFVDVSMISFFLYSLDL